jgi:hypothetical protein
MKDLRAASCDIMTIGQYCNLTRVASGGALCQRRKFERWRELNGHGFHHGVKSIDAFFIPCVNRPPVRLLRQPLSRPAHHLQGGATKHKRAEVPDDQYAIVNFRLGAASDRRFATESATLKEIASYRQWARGLQADPC